MIDESVDDVDTYAQGDEQEGDTKVDDVVDWFTENDVIPSNAKLSILRKVYLEVPALRSLMRSSTVVDLSPIEGMRPRR